MAKSGEFHSKVVGVTFSNDDGSSRQEIIRKHVRVGMQVAFKLGTNPKYPNSVALFVRSGGLLGVGAKEFQIGYIRDEMAGELSRHVMNGGRLEIAVSDVTGGKGKSYGVNILIRKS